jgi:hypothetical protein
MSPPLSLRRRVRCDGFAESVDHTSTGRRVGLLVVTASGYAHTRDDGVTVAPLAALGP